MKAHDIGHNDINFDVQELLPRLRIVLEALLEEGRIEKMADGAFKMKEPFLTVFALMVAAEAVEIEKKRIRQEMLLEIIPCKGMA